MMFYRKYRPSEFGEIIGQEHIVKVLAGAVDSGHLAHAYLFAGGRGTGKTTVARILARSVGCSPNDLYEIDAASNRGIDEIRALREAVLVLPLESPRKVYLVDEVHMLTRDAFNALLKTLEEPPAHVVFILATTEQHKVPATIVSRCQTFVFRQPTLGQLRQLVERVASAEAVIITPAAAELIALLADGSFRDAMVILQQVLAASASKKITVDEVTTATGAPPAALARQLAEALIKADTAAALGLVREAENRQADLKTLIKMTLQSMRLALILKIDPKLAETLTAGLGPEEIDWLRGLSQHPGVKRLPDLLRGLLIAYDQISQAAVPVLPLELAVLELTGESP